MNLNLTIRKMSNYEAFLSKGIRPNSFVISRTSGLKFRVGRIDPDGTAYCYRKDENGQMERYDFHPGEVDLHQDEKNDLITMTCPCGETYSVGAFMEHAKNCKIISGPAGVWQYVLEQFHFQKNNGGMENDIKQT